MKTKLIIYVVIAASLTASVAVTTLSSGGSLSQLPITEDVRNTSYADASVAECTYADPRCLIGFNQNVFVGRVMRIVGHEETPYTGDSSTQFEVHVFLNIKGNLRGRVEIAQYDQTQMAQVGSTYLFAVIYSPTTGWYTFGAREQFQLLSSDDTLSDDQLAKIAKVDSRVIQLEQAYPSEILSGWQRGSGPKYNTYTSRCLDASGVLIDDTVQLQRERQGLAKSECVTRLMPETPAPTPQPDTTAQDRPAATPRSVTPAPPPPLPAIPTM